jgi:CheY-like chemotaxis protein
MLQDVPRARSYLQMIHTAATDAASVVSRLREFYRMNAEDAAHTPVDLVKLAEQAATLTRPKWKDQAQASGATVEMILDLQPVPVVAGEESALREVLTNLIFNAVDAMPKGGRLTIRTRALPEAALIQVEDTGSGMTEEVRRRCLEPFFSTKGERGTGLGLSMVFGIVQRHSGTIDLRSAPGHGTAFAITLPQMQETAAPAAAETTRAAGRLRVLVVDDEEPVRATLSAALEHDGHEVTTASHGVEGLRQFMAGTFDLVVTDRAMPGMSGEQMAAAIKQIKPRMPIILVTGFGDFLEKESFPEIDALASKPITIATLRQAITTALHPA